MTLNKRALAKRGLALVTFAILTAGLTSCAPAGDLSGNEEPGTEFEAADPVTPAPADLQIPFVEKELSSQAVSSVLSKYQHLDPNHVVPTALLEKALTYFDQNKSRFANQNYIAVCDFAKNSKNNRFYIINMKTGAVDSLKVAHGKGSDSNNDGLATTFSNTSGSGMSSVGYYRTDSTYTGKHGRSLRIDGLSTTNSKVRSRAIVIHGASYVEESYIRAQGRAGRSLGCFAFGDSIKDKVIDKLKGGALLYATN